MKKVLYILMLIISFTSLYAKDKENIVEVKKLVWPSPPDDARIEYINSVKNAKDLGIEKGFFSKVFDFIVGQGEVGLSAPFGIHVEKNRVYVTDILKKALFIFDKKKHKVITVNGSDNENFLYPIDVTTDKDGNIYVADAVRGEVFVFDDDGDFSYTISLEVLKRPVGLAVDKNNKKLYIVDPVSSQIHVTTLKGKYIKSIGTPGFNEGEFNRATFIDVGEDGKIYVSDSMNHRVQILDSDGNYISSFGKLGQNIGDFGSPRGIALDSQGNIYVSDTMFNTIQIFNQNGELLMVFGHYGGREGEFSLAEDISISDDYIYITDTNNKRIQVFKLIETSQIRGAK